MIQNFMSNFSQKGVILFLTIAMLTIILALVLGLGAILIGQVKTVRGMWYSVVALYAADTGIEEVLKVIIKDSSPPDDIYPPKLLGNDASYKVEVVCCAVGNPDCVFNGITVFCDVVNTDGESDEDSNCKASRYCIRSVGTFKDAKRAIEVGL